MTKKTSTSTRGVRRTKKTSTSTRDVRMTKKPRARRREPSPAPAAALEQRALPLVSELARVAKDHHPPYIKLEGALEILLGAYGESDPEFSGLFLAGWLRAREDKDFRLTLAWPREQIRL